jgi:hypothetical protein
MKAMGIIKDAEDIIYLGASHGITATHQEGINSELLRFVESWQRGLREGSWRHRHQIRLRTRSC